MIHIKLFCSAGMSTSMLAARMQEAATKRGLEATVAAFPETTLENETNECNVALLGPQVKFMLKKATDICEPKGVPVAVIPMREYGTMNGEAVLDIALGMMK